MLYITKYFQHELGKACYTHMECETCTTSENPYPHAERNGVPEQYLIMQVEDLGVCNMWMNNSIAVSC